MSRTTITRLAILGIAGLSLGLSRPAVAEDHPSLKQIMTHLGQAMAQVSDAIWAEDFHTIAHAGEHIGGHDDLSPQQRAQIAKILGKDMARFEATDETAHTAARAMAAAAHKQDMPGVLQAYGKLQQSCVACHTAFRGRIKGKS
jgi:mono/diheme cytochrome c family protein